MSESNGSESKQQQRKLCLQKISASSEAIKREDYPAAILLLTDALALMEAEAADRATVIEARSLAQACQWIVEANDALDEGDLQEAALLLNQAEHLGSTMKPVMQRLATCRQRLAEAQAKACDAAPRRGLARVGAVALALVAVGVASVLLGRFWPTGNVSETPKPTERATEPIASRAPAPPVTAPEEKPEDTEVAATEEEPSSSDELEQRAATQLRRLQHAVESERWEVAAKYLAEVDDAYSQTSAVRDAEAQLAEWRGQIADAITRDPIEMEAAALVQQIGQAVGEERWSDADEAIQALTSKYENTAVAKRNADRVASWRIQIADGLRKSDAGFEVEVIVALFEEAIERQDWRQAGEALERLQRDYRGTTAAASIIAKSAELKSVIDAGLEAEPQATEGRAAELLTSLRAAITDNDYLLAYVLLDTLQAHYGNTKAAERLDRYEKQIRANVDRLKIEVTPDYLLQPMPRPTGPWDDGMKQAKELLTYITKRQSKRRPAVAVIRVRMEDPQAEPNVAAEVEDANSWSCCWGWGGTLRAKSGGCMLTSPDTRNVDNPRAVFEPMRHGAAHVDLSFVDHKALPVADVFLRRLPAEVTGNLVVVIEPEEGLSPDGAFVECGRCSLTHGVRAPINERWCAVFPRLRPGHVRVQVADDSPFYSEVAKTEVTLGKTRVVRVPVLAHRDVLLRWWAWTREGGETWQSGAKAVRTGTSLEAVDVFGGRRFPIVRFELADKDTVNVRRINCVSKRISAAQFDAHDLAELRGRRQERDASQWAVNAGDAFVIADRKGSKEWFAVMRIESIARRAELARRPSQN